MISSRDGSAAIDTDRRPGCEGRRRQEQHGIRDIFRLAGAARKRANGTWSCACQPGLSRVVSAHTKLSIDLMLSDRLIGLIDEGMDVVVRIGPPQDSGLVMLADNRRIVVGAPSYLQRRGTSTVPVDLEDHECLRCDNGEVTHDRALADCGLILKSHVKVEPPRCHGGSVEQNASGNPDTVSS